MSLTLMESFVMWSFLLKRNIQIQLLRKETHSGALKYVYIPQVTYVYQNACFSRHALNKRFSKHVYITYS